MLTQNHIKELPLHFCPQPWVGIDVTPTGGFKPCCKYKGEIAGSLDKYLNSKELEELKHEFLSGGKPTGCERCWIDEESGNESKRQQDLKYYLDPHDLDKIRLVSFSFGNTCNLACRTCGSGSSSRWVTEERRLLPHFPEIQIQTTSKHHRDEALMSEVARICESAKLIEFPGGEPFITGIPEHLSLLRSLVDNGSAADISLHYITNTTVFPQQEFWDLWRNFKQLDIQLSVDGVGEQFEYLRWPAVWYECYQNIKRYQQQPAHNLKLSISHTVSILNVLDVHRFEAWCMREGLPRPYIGMVKQPEHYSIDNLPAIIVERMLASQRWPETSVVRKRLELALQRGNHEQHLEKFLQLTSVLDSHRTQSLSGVFPELYSILTRK